MAGQIPVLGTAYGPRYLMTGARLAWAAVQALKGEGQWGWRGFRFR